MPSRSLRQQRMMRGAAHSPDFARKVGVSPKVAKEFVAEDKKAGKRALPEKVK